MVNVAKTYLVEDADENAGSGIAPGVFPGTLQGLLDALDAARFRSSSTRTAIVLAIVQGEQQTVIRKFDSGTETWSASTAEIRRERENGAPGQ
jgi:hypothetical protein